MCSFRPALTLFSKADAFLLANLSKLGAAFGQKQPFARQGKVRLTVRVSPCGNGLVGPGWWDGLL